MKKQYEMLRRLVAPQYAIIIVDKETLTTAKVAIKPIREEFPWTHFIGKNIEDALQRAINKLQNPSKDYIALDGFVWKADEESIYEERHIRLFLSQSKLVVEETK